VLLITGEVGVFVNMVLNVGVRLEKGNLVGCELLKAAPAPCRQQQATCGGTQFRNISRCGRL
jgi:hypothetical protein